MNMNNKIFFIFIFLFLSNASAIIAAKHHASKKKSTAATPSVNKTNHSVYVENTTAGKIATLVQTNNKSHSKTTNEKDKDWVRLDKDCIQSIIISDGNNALEVGLPADMPTCTNLSLKVAEQAGRLVIIQATNNDNLKGSPLDLSTTFGPITAAQEAAFTAAGAGGIFTIAKAKLAAAPKPHDVMKQLESASPSTNKTSHEVYIVNTTSSPIITLVQTNNKPHSMTTKANDKDWIHVDKDCVTAVIINQGENALQVNLPEGTMCMNLSLKIAAQNGQLAVVQATDDNDLKGSPLKFTAHFGPLNASQKAALNTQSHQVFVKNQAKIDVDVHVYTTSTSANNTVCMAVARNDIDWLHINEDCIQYIVLRTVLNEARLDFISGSEDLCSNISLLVDVDAHGRPILVRTTNDLNLKGSTVNLFRLTHEAPLMPETV